MIFRKDGIVNRNQDKMIIINSIQSQCQILSQYKEIHSYHQIVFIYLL
jgi:hypothetical protein